MSNEVPDDIIALSNKIVSRIGIKDFELILEGGNDKGEGYLGEIIFLQLKDKSSGKSLYIVVKRAFLNDQVRDTSPIRKTFLNEIYLYDKIMPSLQRFQEENGLGKFDKISKCYLTNSEDCNEYIVLENNKKLGYEIFDKTKILSYQHLEFIFKTYAQLHASSYLFRKYQTEEFNKLVSNIQDLTDDFLKKDIFDKIWQTSFALAAKTLKPGEDDSVIKAYEKYTQKGIDIFEKAWTYTGKYPLLTHGDCWSNNMMFKFNENGTMTDLKLLDWQLIKVGSPVHDLSYCLYSGASADTFDRLDELLKTYYDSFSSVLRKVGENPGEIYPFSVLKDEWTEYCKFGLLISIVVIKIKMTKQEEKVDLVELSMSDNKEEMAQKFSEGTPSEEYDKRIRELLLHIYKIGGL